MNLIETSDLLKASDGLNRFGGSLVARMVMYIMRLNKINKLYSDKFWIMLNSIFTDYLIAYCIQSEGNKYKGSSKAYNLGLPWGRTKEIRDFVMPYDSEYLFETAMKVADLD